jgi:hypothetical protein
MCEDQSGFGFTVPASTLRDAGNHIAKHPKREQQDAPYSLDRRAEPRAGAVVPTALGASSSRPAMAAHRSAALIREGPNRISQLGFNMRMMSW